MATAATAAEIEIQADVAVVVGLQTLVSEFSHMLTEIRQPFFKFDLAAVQFYLTDLLGTDEFYSCDTSDKVLQQLRKRYVDTFNISRLKQLADHFQSNPMKELIEVYETKLEKFLDETVVCKFYWAIINQVDPVLPREMAVVKIKVPEFLADNRTLKDIERLACKAFGSHYKSFVRLSAEPGSIIITWFYPKTLTPALKQLALEHAVGFAQEEVEEISVDGIIVFG